MRRKVAENLFAAALPAVEPWDEFPWHTDREGLHDSWLPYASQALAIDLLGSLKVAPSEVRTAILDALVTELGLSAGGPWSVELEWIDPADRLAEPSPSQIDAVALGRHAIIFLESKFTEAGGGPCSQVKRLTKGRHRDLVQCDGRYAMQRNPVNGRRGRCALTAKGIRYWEQIPALFDVPADRDHAPCPFAGAWFQLMRNLVLVRETASADARQAGFVIVYADHLALPFPRWLRSPDWARFNGLLRKDGVPMRAISHQAIVKLAIAALSEAGFDAAVWIRLESWIQAKIERAAGRGTAERGA